MDCDGWCLQFKTTPLDELFCQIEFYEESSQTSKVTKKGITFATQEEWG